MKTSEVCYVCGSRGASCILYVRPQDSGVSYFSFLESHVPPRGARKPASDGAVHACTVCSAFLNQQWDSFERTRTPLIKRLYWLKRTDNGAFTGAEMSVQGEYVAQLMGLHGGISASCGGGSPFDYSNHAGISCGKPDLIASDDEESVTSDSTNGALDLSVSPRKQERQTRKRCLTKTSNMGVGTKKRSSNGVVSNVMCYICRSICHQALARFIYAFKSSADEPHFPFLLDICPPAGAMPLTKAGVTQVCAECRKTLTRQWRSYESRGICETDRVYRVSDVAYPKRHKSLRENVVSDRKQKSAPCIGTDICYLCGQPNGATHWIATRTGGETEMLLPFVAQLKCPTGARPIGADGRTRTCSLCYIHIKEQWQKFDADSVPQEKRTFVLRPVTKTLSSASTDVDSDIKCKQKILTDCPVLATVLSSDAQSDSEVRNEHCHSKQAVPSYKLQSAAVDNSAHVKTSVGLPNGICTLTNGRSTSIFCYICGLDCGEVNAVGKLQTGVHRLYVSPTDIASDISQVDSKGSLLKPFFPFLADLCSPLHNEAAAVHENAVHSCTLCYVNLHQQWHAFEMSSDAAEQHRWHRQYIYKTVVCNVCHVSVERQEISVVSSEKLTRLQQSVDSSVDGLSLVCRQCCQSLFLFSPNESVAHSAHTTENAITVSILTVFCLFYKNYIFYIRVFKVNCEMLFLCWGSLFSCFFTNVIARV